MLDDALDTLKENDKPVIHSDRVGHYRWPGWLDRINTSGLIRSDARRIMRRVKASSGVSKTKCSMAGTGLVSRWKNLSVSWTGTYVGITRSVLNYH